MWTLWWDDANCAKCRSTNICLWHKQHVHHVHVFGIEFGVVKTARSVQAFHAILKFHSNHSVCAFFSMCWFLCFVGRRRCCFISQICTLFLDLVVKIHCGAWEKHFQLQETVDDLRCWYDNGTMHFKLSVTPSGKRATKQKISSFVYVFEHPLFHTAEWVRSIHSFHAFDSAHSFFVVFASYCCFVYLHVTSAIISRNFQPTWRELYQPICTWPSSVVDHAYWTDRDFSKLVANFVHPWVTHWNLYSYACFCFLFRSLFGTFNSIHIILLYHAIHVMYSAQSMHWSQSAYSVFSYHAFCLDCIQFMQLIQFFTLF